MAGYRRYRHDCSVCKYLGRYQEYDVYVCPQHGAPTIVARYGSKGHQYKSGASIHSLDEVLAWGLQEAFTQGYVVLDGTAKLTDKEE